MMAPVGARASTPTWARIHMLLIAALFIPVVWATSASDLIARP